MTLGARANLAENFASAEQAYRAALAVQQKALGRDDPNTVEPLMHLALQVSDAGPVRRGGHACSPAPRRWRRVPPTASLPARLLHYRALHALNQGKLAEALALLRQRGSRPMRRWCRPNCWLRRPRGCRLASIGVDAGPRPITDPTVSRR